MCSIQISLKFAAGGPVDNNPALAQNMTTMETFSALLALCAWNSPATGEFPHKSQWRSALMFTLICAWISRWVNNREAGDLRRHRAHYDVIVIKCFGAEQAATD